SFASIYDSAPKKPTDRAKCQQNRIRLRKYQPKTTSKPVKIIKTLPLVQNTAIQHGKQVHSWRIITILLRLPANDKN
ncbi:hypothetical protein, partial [Aeromonas sobria]|uniref:hypothetical protein n=1 Tax=Aeromonas sobria TaxID=646 RepID=UPI003F3DA38C